MFIAPEGYSFGYFDLGQAEARLVAWFAGIESWMEQFEKARIDGKYDAHRALASDMFNIPYEDFPSSDYNLDGTKSIRFTAIRCRHGLNYRMQPGRLAITTGMGIREASKNYQLYHSLVPE